MSNINNFFKEISDQFSKLFPTKVNDDKETLDKFLKLYYLLYNSPIKLLSDKLYIEKKKNTRTDC